MIPVVGAVLSLLFFQPPLALAALIVLLGAWLLESRHHFSWKVLAIFALILLVVIVAAGAVLRSLPSLQSSSGLDIFLTWLQNNFGYQSHLAERASGMLQKVLDTVQNTLGEQWKLPVILIYGLAQPVLPATLVDDAAWIWRVINVLRALGWYILAPLVFYALITLLRAGKIPRRRQLSWLALAVWIWALVAAANAGGDLWDNPRYRSIFLVWWVLLAGWGWVHARQQRDVWLKRLLAVEAVFVLIFLEWYLSRIYPGIFFHLDIFVMFALTLVVCAAILAGGWWWDQRRKARGS
jgi:peptidoglycan/LPS O-acetylase OafA/YrhL